MTTASDYSCSKVLGQGAFGRVEKCTGPNGKPYALKYMVSGVSKFFKREMCLLKAVPNNSFLPRYITDITNEKGYNIIVSEFIEGQNMGYYAHKITTKKMKVPNPDILLILMKTAFLGLWVLHDSGIVHGDIKPENLMVRGAKIVNRELTLDRRYADAGVVLVDLGLSCYMGESKKTCEKNYMCQTVEMAGSPRYIHPYASENRPGGDTWALMYSFLGLTLASFIFPSPSQIKMIKEKRADPFKIFRITNENWLKKNRYLQETYYFYKADSGIDSIMKGTIFQPGLINYVDIKELMKEIKPILIILTIAGVAGVSYAVGKKIYGSMKRKKAMAKKKPKRKTLAKKNPKKKV